MNKSLVESVPDNIILDRILLGSISFQIFSSKPLLSFLVVCRVKFVVVNVNS